MSSTMEYKMEIFTLILCVIPAIVTSITVSSNGNSPEIKMLGGMMVDAQKEFSPVIPKLHESSAKSNYEKSRQLHTNSTQLAINERYRRLIPYMTFYYANDIAIPNVGRPTDVEVEKAEMVEAVELEPPQHRQPKKIVHSPRRNIPRYQGNRLTQFNIASANPRKIYYKDGVSVYQNQNKVTPNYNPLLSEYILINNEFDPRRIIPKPIPRYSSVPVPPVTRNPYLNPYKNQETANIQYYLSEREPPQKYKLVPYEQTPPIKAPLENQNDYEIKRPYVVSLLVPKEQDYVKLRPTRPQYLYDNVDIQPSAVRKQPIISESYYEKQRPQPLSAHPIIESGFKPIINSPAYTTEAAIYTSTIPETPKYDFENQNQQTEFDTASVAPVSDYKPNYYQYVVDKPTYKPALQNIPTNTLASLLNSLQLNKSIPKPITRENVSSSIRTLLQVLNTLKAVPQQNEVEIPALSTPQPFVAPKLEVEVTNKPVEQVQETPSSLGTNEDDEDFHEKPYLAPVNTPSQHLDDFPTGGTTSQQFPLPVTSDNEGGTPGRSGIDYPIFTTIPQTAFDCKTQRYKGFFADPETRCQVWHYCDLNGGQASFLCPNGTIFSQAALTCDWWFNVRCASTTQLYVLNESLYKFILPHSPKFPEDYSGPLVDKYLTLKFKEMEEQFKKNKSKQAASDKIDSDEANDSGEVIENETDNLKKTEHSEKSKVGSVNEASVIVESPGTSGNVERLHE